MAISHDSAFEVVFDFSQVFFFVPKFKHVFILNQTCPCHHLYHQQTEKKIIPFIIHEFKKPK